MKLWIDIAFHCENALLDDGVSWLTFPLAKLASIFLLRYVLSMIDKRGPKFIWNVCS
jgi:hypothetical protein